MTVKKLNKFIFENYYRQTGSTKKTFIINETSKEKDLLLLATKLVNKYLMPVILNNTINYF